MADKIIDKINALSPGSNFFSLEFFPPKTQPGFSNLLPRLQRLRALNPLFVCVTWGAGGSTATKSLELAELCHTQLGFTTCLHLTCTNMRKTTLDAALERARQIGIRNILALRGDEPREGEYGSFSGPSLLNGVSSPSTTDGEEEHKFEHAVDLIRYIREQHGDYFCIGAAAYPEGHPEPNPALPDAIEQDPARDVPFLVEKVRVGADFLLTQLFYDIEAFLRFERLLREHPSGAFHDGLPLIPGLMPVQGWQSFRRTCKLARVGVPRKVEERLESAKWDDEAVKSVGVEVTGEIIDKIRMDGWRATPQGRHGTPQGFHFYTLNLEKAVAQTLERCELLPVVDTPVVDEEAIDDSGWASPTRSKSPNDARVANGDTVESPEQRRMTMHRRRVSSSRNSIARNRVIKAHTSSSGKHPELEAPQDEAGVPKERTLSRKNALAIAEGEGSLGREATWDDYPNGRWGDSRSPAFGFDNNYTIHPQLAPAVALITWGSPSTVADITSIFRRYLAGALTLTPWSDEPLSAETSLIAAPLQRLTDRGWWTVASQPAVNAAPSTDDVVGWGPRTGGGFVWQKPFVEMFMPAADWRRLRARLEALGDEVTYFAGDMGGAFEASDEASVNPVTWGAFKGKEIVSPTIIEAESFRAWQEEAFGIWREWQHIFRPRSASAKLLREVGRDVWLVNVICHQYFDANRLWDVLLEE